MAKKKRAPPPFMTGQADGGYQMLFFDMLFSPAWSFLSPAARSIYIAMRTLYGPRNHFRNTFRCTYSWMEKHANVRRGSIRSYLEELTIAGFIEITALGGRNTPNEYEFSDTWKKITSKDIPHLNELLTEFKESQKKKKEKISFRKEQAANLDLGNPSTRLVIKQ